MLYIEQLERMHRRYIEARGKHTGLQAAEHAAPANYKISRMASNACRMLNFYSDLVGALRTGTRGLIKFITAKGGLNSYADVVSVEEWTGEIDKWIGAEESQVIRDLLGGLG